jgi:integrase
MDKDLTALGLRLGIRLGWHDLRRSFARQLYYDHGVEINTIRALLSHKSPETTVRYIGDPEERMRKAVSVFDRPKVTPPEAVLMGT